MTDVVPQLGLIAALVVLNAIFAGSELALVSLREGQLQRMEADGGAGEIVARLARQPSRFLATIQVGITLAGFLASASAAVSLAEPLESPLAFLGNAARPASIIVVTIVLSYVTLVIGELAPKRVAMQRAEAWAKVTARPLMALSTAARPVVWFLSRSTDVAVRLMGADPSRHREDVTEEEIRDMVAAQEAFTDEQRAIIDGAFEIAERTLSEVLRPRGEVVVIDADAPCAEAADLLVATGHSRAPVAPRRDLDAVLGIVHLRNLVSGGETPVQERVSDAMFLPESATVLDVLRAMQKSRQQLAIVLNEHGGTEGIITIEDLLEELVGEIYDEADRDILSVIREPDGSLVVPGRFPAHDLDDIGVQLPEGEYSTVAGAVLAALGRIPEEPGDVVRLDAWEAVVLEVQGRAVTSVRLRPAPPPADEGQDEH